MISSLGLMLAFSAAILFAAYGLVSRVLAKESEDVLAFSALYGFYAGILSFIVFVFELYPLGLYMAITYVFPSIYILVFLKNRFLRMREEIRNTTWKLPVLSFISVLGYYLLLKTFSLTEASIAVPIIYTSTLLTALGGIVILKEQSSVWQKIFGAVFVFLGVILLR